MLIPIFQSLSKEMSDKVYFAKVDIDRSLEITQEYKIVSISTMIIFKNGKVVGRIEGLVSEEEIVNKVQECK